MLNMILYRLRRKTQWWEANLKVWWSWVPNTFPRTYLNFEPISLVVKSMVLSQKDAILIVPRSLQKTRWRLLRCVHSGDSTRDCEFNSYVPYFLTLIKKKLFQYLFAHTSLSFFCPLTSIGDEWEDGRLHSSSNLAEFIPSTHNQCHRLLWGLSILNVCYQSTMGST